MTLEQERWRGTEARNLFHGDEAGGGNMHLGGTGPEGGAPVGRALLTGQFCSKHIPGAGVLCYRGQVGAAVTGQGCHKFLPGAFWGRCTCGQAGTPIDGARLQQICFPGEGHRGEALDLAGPSVDCASRISVGESTGGDERWPLRGRMDAERSCHWRWGTEGEGSTWPTARKR